METKPLAIAVTGRAVGRRLVPEVLSASAEDAEAAIGLQQEGYCAEARPC